MSTKKKTISKKMLECKKAIEDLLVKNNYCLLSHFDQSIWLQDNKSNTDIKLNVND